MQRSYEQEQEIRNQERSIRDARIEYLIHQNAKWRIITAFMALIAMVAIAWAIGESYRQPEPLRAAVIDYTPEFAPSIETLQTAKPPKPEPKVVKKPAKKAAAKKIAKPKASSYFKTYKITYYCSCSKCCGKSDGITASGKRVAEGRTCAVNGLPFGTKVRIPGIGTRIVEDRVGRDGVLDIYVDSHAKALELGTKTVKCEVYR